MMDEKEKYLMESRSLRSENRNLKIRLDNHKSRCRKQARIINLLGRYLRYLDTLESMRDSHNFRHPDLLDMDKSMKNERKKLDKLLVDMEVGRRGKKR